MDAISNTRNRYPLGIITLCLFYLFFELFFNTYSIITVDEFWFAHSIYQYKDHLPYRDFLPYKTVMGYYFLLPTMLVYPGIISTLIFTKNSLAVLNACLLLLAARWLLRFFSAPAVFASLCILVLSESFLTYSTNIRVDLLAYWFALFSILLILEKRYLFAGLLMGFGFIISQKCIWYIFAIDCALGVQLLLFARNKSTLMRIILFNISTLAIIGAYLAYWSWISNWHTVYQNIFGDAALMYRLDSHENNRKIFWEIISLYNPLLFLLWPYTLISALITVQHDKSYQMRIFIITLSFLIIACLIPFKQPFPYNMQVTFPALLLLYAAFFQWGYELFSQKVEVITNPILIYAFNIVYIAWIMATIRLMHLPTPYALLCVIPITFMCMLPAKNQYLKYRSTGFKMIMTTLLLIGIAYPLALFTVKLSKSNGEYQKQNLQAMQALLTNNDGYVAGIELLFNKSQPIPGLRHLDVTGIRYLQSPTEALRPHMLASLYQTPDASIKTVIANLNKSSVKFYVNNYRMQKLPVAIKQYLANEYEHFWGSIYLYAPVVAGGKRIVLIKFANEYEVQSPSKNRVRLDNKLVVNGDRVYLSAGEHTSYSLTRYRLKLLPTNISPLNPNFANDQWNKMLV